MCVHGDGRCSVHMSKSQAAWVAAGIVLAKEGGALGKMLPVFNIFAGGPLGTGRQWCSWIHRRAPPARHMRCGPAFSMRPHPSGRLSGCRSAVTATSVRQKCQCPNAYLAVSRTPRAILGPPSATHPLFSSRTGLGVPPTWEEPPPHPGGVATPRPPAQGRPREPVHQRAHPARLQRRVQRDRAQPRAHDRALLRAGLHARPAVLDPRARFRPGGARPARGLPCGRACMARAAPRAPAPSGSAARSVLASLLWRTSCSCARMPGLLRHTRCAAAALSCGPGKPGCTA